MSLLKLSGIIFFYSMTILHRDIIPSNDLGSRSMEIQRREREITNDFEFRSIPIPRKEKKSEQDFIKTSSFFKYYSHNNNKFVSTPKNKRQDMSDNNFCFSHDCSREVPKQKYYFFDHPHHYDSNQNVIDYRIEAKDLESEKSAGIMCVKKMITGETKESSINFDELFRNMFYYAVVCPFFNDTFTSEHFYTVLQNKFPEKYDSFFNFMISFCASNSSGIIKMNSDDNVAYVNTNTEDNEESVDITKSQRELSRTLPMHILMNNTREYTLMFLGPSLSKASLFLETLIKIACKKTDDDMNKKKSNKNRDHKNRDRKEE